ncbi:MAG TPA: 4-(cytidine 5'-diphospho)-2-C-methyl-D-erythritol kinase [Aliiroseovarius sp.]|nr:4-(cytidine 5'-diphospho)-2-C-methyl-D-erythritol kinase [Aliiroseovarius sp.]
MATVKAFAAAKLNLTLHVTGQRDDGFHLLDSLVLFLTTGDRVTVSGAEALQLSVTGPFGPRIPAGDDNLVLRAARLIGPGKGAKITLEKNLPPASGIGGGSADAAATLWALSQLWRVPMPSVQDLMGLGADIPVCLGAQFARMGGTGEQVTPLGKAPDFNILLVNPGVSVSTPDIFKALEQKENPAMPTLPDTKAGPDAWLDWLQHQRNDLEAPAIRTQPVIADVLDAMRALPGCRLARMSGSGATCFALMDKAGAGCDLKAAHPEWWVVESNPI